MDMKFWWMADLMLIVTLVRKMNQIVVVMPAVLLFTNTRLARCYALLYHKIGNFLLCRRKDGSPQLGLIDYGTF
jgi:ABC-type phosphate/phosphonate transport system permease subunit